MIGLLPLFFQQSVPVLPETKEFSFWVGDWDCEGTTQKGSQKAENHVTMDFDGHVVHEHFKMAAYRGESWSVFSPNDKHWHQTWVDNSGAYIALVGSWADGKMTLMTAPHGPDGKSIRRMVYSNVKPESFDWDWQHTDDGGTTWSTDWHLHYTRMRGSKKAE